MLCSCYLYSPHMDNWIENDDRNKSLNIAKDGRHEELTYINYIIENKVKELTQNVDTLGMLGHFYTIPTVFAIYLISINNYWPNCLFV